MTVRLPQFKPTLPSWAAFWTYARAAIMAVAVILTLVGLAHWRSNSRLDRDGLERLAQGATAVVPAVPAGKGKPASR